MRSIQSKLEIVHNFHCALRNVVADTKEILEIAVLDLTEIKGKKVEKEEVLITGIRCYVDESTKKQLQEYYDILLTETLPKPL